MSALRRSVERARGGAADDDADDDRRRGRREGEAPAKKAAARRRPPAKKAPGQEGGTAAARRPPPPRPRPRRRRRRRRRRGQAAGQARPPQRLTCRAPRGRRDDPLAEYRAKRDPRADRRAGAGRPGSRCPAGDDDTFVVQEHHTPRGRTRRARALGPAAGARRRPEELGGAEGAADRAGRQPARRPHRGPPAGVRLLRRARSPPASTAAAHVTIWDAGRYATEKWDERHIIVHLRRPPAGRPLRAVPAGRRRLEHPQARRHAARAGADAPRRRCRCWPPPASCPPPTRTPRWGYEFKWDGVRAVAAVHGGVLALTSRKGTDITVRYPEVARLPDALAGHDAVVDGEIVAMDDRGRPDFGALQNRMHRTGPEVPRMAAAAPVTYLVFDLLRLGRRGPARPALRRAAGAARRARARRAPLGGHAVVPRAAGPTCWPPARRTGSRASSPSGWTRRTGPGCAAPTGARSRTSAPSRSSSAAGGRGRAGGPATIGSLLFGVPDDEGRLVYAGHVGTGFSDAGPARPAAHAHAARTTSPFDGDAAARGHPRRALGRARPGRRGGLRGLDGGRPAAAPVVARACGTTWSPTTWWWSREPGEAAGGDRRPARCRCPTWRRCSSRRSAFTKAQVIDYYVRDRAGAAAAPGRPAGHLHPLARRRRGADVLREEQRPARARVGAPGDHPEPGQLDRPGDARHGRAGVGRRPRLGGQPRRAGAARAAVAGRRRRRPAAARPAGARPRPRARTPGSPSAARSPSGWASGWRPTAWTRW